MIIVLMIVGVLSVVISIIVAVRKNEEEAFQNWYQDKLLPYAEEYFGGDFRHRVSFLDEDLFRSIYLYEHDPERAFHSYLRYKNE